MKIDFRKGERHDQQIRHAERRLEAFARLRRQIDHDPLVAIPLFADLVDPDGLVVGAGERRASDAEPIGPVPQPGRRRALRVGVDQQHRALHLGQTAGQVHGYGALAGAPLEVADGDDSVGQGASHFECQ
jgi:hypothetical protein